MGHHGTCLAERPLGPPSVCSRVPEAPGTGSSLRQRGTAVHTRLRSALRSGVGPLGGVGWSGWALLGRWRNAQGGGWCGCWQDPQVTRWAKDRSRVGSDVELRGGPEGGVALIMAAWPPGPGPLVHRRRVAASGFPPNICLGRSWPQRRQL